MNEQDDRTLDLLIARATQGLGAQEESELRARLKATGVEGDDELDLAVAAAMNALAVADRQDPSSAMPEALRQRLLADADAYFDDADPSVLSLPEQPIVAASSARFAGWVWAAAAVLVIAIALTYQVERPVSPADARAQLVAEHVDTVVWPWAVPSADEYQGVTGDVVWNDRLQQGYLRLVGMPVNDPTQSQYQLWIVDPDRDTHPVDGGVFDIPGDATEVLVPIDAKLTVDAPTAFAITREQPGGVVVSAGPLLVVAAG